MYISVFYNHNDKLHLVSIDLDYVPKLNDLIRINGEHRRIITRDIQEFPEFECVVYYCELCHVITNVTDFEKDMEVIVNER